METMETMMGENMSVSGTGARWQRSHFDGFFFFNFIEFFSLYLVLRPYGKREDQVEFG